MSFSYTLNGASVRVRFQGGVDDAGREAFAMQMTTSSYLLADYFDRRMMANLLPWFRGQVTPIDCVIMALS